MISRTYSAINSFLSDDTQANGRQNYNEIFCEKFLHCVLWSNRIVCICDKWLRREMTHPARPIHHNNAQESGRYSRPVKMTHDRPTQEDPTVVPYPLEHSITSLVSLLVYWLYDYSTGCTTTVLDVRLLYWLHD